MPAAYPKAAVKVVARVMKKRSNVGKKKRAWKKLTLEELNVAKQLYAKDMDPSKTGQR